MILNDVLREDFPRQQNSPLGNRQARGEARRLDAYQLDSARHVRVSLDHKEITACVNMMNGVSYPSVPSLMEKIESGLGDITLCCALVPSVCEPMGRLVAIPLIGECDQHG